MLFFLSVMLSVVANIATTDDFKTLENVRRTHRQALIDGEVFECELDGVSHYVFNGKAEFLFDTPNAESDVELEEEALLNARQNLASNLLSKRNGTISLANTKMLLSYKTSKAKHVVVAVPVKDVSIRIIDNKAITDTTNDNHAVNFAAECRERLCARPGAGMLKSGLNEKENKKGK